MKVFYALVAVIAFNSGAIFYSQERVSFTTQANSDLDLLLNNLSSIVNLKAQYLNANSREVLKGSNPDAEGKIRVNGKFIDGLSARIDETRDPINYNQVSFGIDSFEADGQVTNPVLTLKGLNSYGGCFGNLEINEEYNCGAEGGCRRYPTDGSIFQYSNNNGASYNYQPTWTQGTDCNITDIRIIMGDKFVNNSNVGEINDYSNTFVGYSIKYKEVLINNTNQICHTTIFSSDNSQYLENQKCVQIKYCGDGSRNGDEQCDLGANNGPNNTCSNSCINQNIVSTPSSCNILVAGRSYYTTNLNQTPTELTNLEYNNLCSNGSQLDRDNFLVQGVTASLSQFRWNCGNQQCLAYKQYCGDNIVQLSHEQCDDGNTTNGDGCNSSCQNETQNISNIIPTNNGGGSSQGGQISNNNTQSNHNGVGISITTSNINTSHQNQIKCEADFDKDTTCDDEDFCIDLHGPKHNYGCPINLSTRHYLKGVRNINEIEYDFITKIVEKIDKGISYKTMIEYLNNYDNKTREKYQINPELISFLNTQISEGIYPINFENYKK